MPFYTISLLNQKLSELGIKLDKNIGQCYLIDENIVHFIIDQAELDPITDNILEIGPGLGTLTNFLAEKSDHLSVIEFDNRMVQFLKNDFENAYPVEVLEWHDVFPTYTPENRPHIVIIHGDALQIPFPPANKIVSNIPYQISGPLMLKLVETWQYERVILMVQKEFAEHILAPPNSDNYSRISAATQLYLDIKRLKNVSASCFFPQPKVNSVIIKITLKPHLSVINSPEFLYRNEYLEFLRGIFPYKNKSIKKAFGFYSKANMKESQKFLSLESLFMENPVLGEKKVRVFGAEELFQLVLYTKTKSDEIIRKFQREYTSK
jgi:16S rRNA (adenine1518-N6/adenine1519-N6)-dimethyltransferase